MKSSKYFPFNKPRDNQLETCDQIIDALADPKIKHVVLEAPTGAGKSVMGMTAANWQNKNSTSIYNRVLFVTGSKALQDQYMRDFNLANIKSSSDIEYLCGHKTTRGEEECLSTIRKTNRKCIKRCPYVDAYKYFKDSSKALTNTSYMMIAPTEVLTPTALMVIDECHELGERIVGASTMNLSVYRSRNLNFVNSDVLNNTIRFLDRLTAMLTDEYDIGDVFTLTDDHLEGIEDRINDMMLVQENLTNALETIGDGNIKVLKNSMDRVKGLIALLTQCINTKGNKFVLKEANQDSIVFQPVYAREFAHAKVFSKANKFLHMSATVCGFEQYCKELGIGQSEAVFIQADHTIPVENREVEFAPVAWMNYKNYDSDVDKTVQFIDAVLDNTNEKGIIHTVSYKRADDIFVRSKHQDRIVVTSNAKEVEAVMRKKDNRLVASPAITTGFDFADDKSRLQFITKVPYPSLGDPRIKYISKVDSSMYSQLVVRTIVQACGRSIRHNNDWAATWILDGNFKRLYDNNRAMFPKWFSESIKW